MRAFHLSTDSDPDLNLFTEHDVERSFKQGLSWFLMCEKSVAKVDALQRWMRDARPGDRRPVGLTAIVCVEVDGRG